MSVGNEMNVQKKWMNQGAAPQGQYMYPQMQQAQQAQPQQSGMKYAQQVQKAQSAQAPKATTAKASKTISLAPAASYTYGQDPGSYTNRFGAILDDIYNQIQNKKTFNYEFSSDPLFQAYKDMYTQHGKQAMMDTMGQAQAMTGGYGNSYAQNAGQQAYQQWMLDLMNKGLEMRDRAYQMNQDELANLYNMAGLYQNAEALDYERYMDAMNNYMANASMSSGGGNGGGGGGTVYAYAGKFYKNENGKLKQVSEEEVRNRGYKINTSYQDGYNVLTGYGTANVKNAKVGNITHGVDPNAYKKAKVGVTWKMPGK